MKYIVALALLALAASGASYAYAPACAGECMVHHNAAVVAFNDRWPSQPMIQYAQASQEKMTTVQTSAPVTSTTTVNGGDLAAQVIEWLEAVFGTIIAGVGTLLIVKVRAYFGILTTDAQKAQLQLLAVNGVNAAASKAEDALRANPNLSVDIKNAVVQDAVAYVQAHGADTIKALGLDPKSGDAVDAIKARVATALNSSTTPTVTSTAVIPVAPVV